MFFALSALLACLLEEGGSGLDDSLSEIFQIAEYYPVGEPAAAFLEVLLRHRLLLDLILVEHEDVLLIVLLG